MKKYLQNRNEQLFNKLFENQNIKADLEEGCKSDEVEEQVQEDSSGSVALLLKPIETDLRVKLKRMIGSGANAQQMATVIKDLNDGMPELIRNLDAMVGYQLAQQDYASPLEELGIPEKSAWQHIEEAHAGADVDAQDTLKDKLSTALTSVLNRDEIEPWIRKVDTDPELTWITGEFVRAVNNIAGTDLNDQEIDRSMFNLRDYIKKLRKEKEEEEEPQTEAHVIATPKEKDEE
tara:strand:+ start:1251 stop:1952 length:702 start_codon:yes stop_codon:yes gene_type:complete